MKRIVAALALALTLAGCAVTGQPANPGTAATFHGVTVTNDDITRRVEAFNDLHVSVDPSAVLTLLLLEPTLEASAADAGILYSDDDLTFEARKWIASQRGDQTEITDGMREAVRDVRTLEALLGGQNTAEDLGAAVQQLEADAVVSPTYGEFSGTAFVESLQSAYGRMADESNLGDVGYLVFKDVSGFTPSAKQPWMVEEGPTASPAPLGG